MKKFSFLFIFSLLLIKVFAQYPPAAGQTGSTAIYKDASVFIDWAVACSISRGYVNISDTSFEDPAYPGTNKASFGNENAANGIADNNIVSLGDNGTAILTFTNPIVNGTGFDFAVFENSFDDFFLELAYVEVSSDGTHFVRFPSVSLTQSDTQIQSFGILDPTKIHNLAGKYKVSYGTPFDLSDLQDSSGVNINHITQIRILDVIGSIAEPFINFDSQGHIINDPFPTPFWTAGFDLDAVGVIHNTQNTGINPENIISNGISIYPIPANDYLNIQTNSLFNNKAQLLNCLGEVLSVFDINSYTKIDIKNLSKGIYFLILKDENSLVTTLKFLKK
jgi:hypothetical protein